MKPMLEKPQGLRLIALSFLGIGTVTFLFFQSQATNEKEHTQIQNLLRQANQSDAELEKEVLSLRFSLLGSCDTIVEKSLQLLNAKDGLESAINNGYPQRPDDLATALNVYRKTVRVCTKIR